MTTKYGKFITALLVLMVFSLSTATLHANGACPDPGSGAAGVSNWADANVGEDCVNPATTCNGHFTIELLGVTVDEEDDNRLTFEYEVCREGGSSALSHWGFSLAGISCLGEGFSYDDLIVDVKLEGVAIAYSIGLDPTTQLVGLKFNQGNGGVGTCNTYSVTFDKAALVDGYTLGVGCTLAATKAGNQDIQRADRATPGYASIAGPVCVPDEATCQTAFAYASVENGGQCFIPEFSRWGWTIELADDGPTTFDVYAGAGQCDLEKGTKVGRVTISLAGGEVLATFVLESGFYAEETHLYAGRDPYPTAKNGSYTVAPGQYYVEPNLSTETGDVHVIFHAVVCGVYD